MAINPLGMNQGTQSFIRFENDGGTINTQIIDLRQGTVTLSNPTGTTITVDHGTVTLSNPTGTTTQFNNGTVDLLKAGTITKLEGGTLNLITRVGNIGTVEVGTISAMPNIPGGTIGVVTSLTNLVAGTITKLEGGTLGILSQGSINVTAGTITSGSIRVVAGTVGGAAATAVALSGNPIPTAGVDSGGTVYGFLVDTKGQQILGGGTVDTLTTVSNLTNGSVRITVGTITVLPNLPQGSINVTAGTVNTGTINLLQAGTITRVENGSIVVVGFVQSQLGTLNAGTVRTDARTTQNIVTYGTQVVGTAAIAGTIIGSSSVGAGTSIWINDFSIVNPYGSVLTTLGFGTAQQGTNILFRGVLGTQTVGGIEKAYPKMTNAGMTNQDLVLSLGAAGTVDLTLSYIISV